MTDTATLPAPPSRDGDDPDTIHLTCCDEDVAMCGEDLAGCPLAAAGETVDCPLCVLAKETGMGCTIPGCPDREVA